MADYNGNNPIKKVAINIIRVLFIKILIIALVIMAIITLFTGGLYVVDKELFKDSTESIGVRNQGATASVSSSSSSGETTVQINTGVSDEELVEQTKELKQYCNMSDEEYKEFIIKVANVGLITQLPYFNGVKEGNTNGIIKFFRENNGKTVQLSYIDEAEFDKKVADYNNTKDNAILNYFKFNDDETIEIAYLTTEIVKITTDDLQIDREYLKNYNEEAEYSEQNNADGTITYTTNIERIETKKINYKQLVTKYTMPSDFLIALLVATESGDFVSEIADLAYNSEINIGIYADTSSTVVQDTYEYVKGVRVDTEAEVKIDFKDYIIQYPGIAYWVDSKDENRNILLLKYSTGATVQSKEPLNGKDQDPDYTYIKQLEKNGDEWNVILTESNNVNLAKKFKTLCEKTFTESTLQANIKEAHTWVMDLQLESTLASYESEEEQTVDVNNEEEYIKLSQMITNGTDGAYKQSVNKATILLNSAKEVAAGIVHSNTEATYNTIHLNISNGDSTEISNLRTYVSQYLGKYGFNNEAIINQAQREFIYSDIIRVIKKLNNIDDINSLDTATESEDTADIYILGKLTELNINNIEGKNDLYKNIINGYIRKKLQISDYTGSIIRIKSTINSRSENIVCNTVESYNSERYTYNPPTITENTDKFVSIFNSERYSGARSLLLSADEWFYEYIEESENTADMIDLVKYLLYKATNRESYKVEGFTIESLYQQNSFSTIDGDIDVSDESLFIKDVETLKKALSWYGEQSRLVEHAQEFLDMQEKYKVNAIFAAAVAVKETSGGTAGMAIRVGPTDWSSGIEEGQTWNCWFSIKAISSDTVYGKRTEDDSKWRVYNTVGDAIDDFGNLISTRGSSYYRSGNYTVVTIGKIYCETPDSWIAGILSYMNNFYQTAGINIETLNPSSNGTASEKLNELFPNGVPTTEAEMKPYLVTIDVALTTKEGVKTTGKLTVHKDLAKDVQSVFKQAQDGGFKIYQASAYCFRYMNNGTTGKLSHHSYGIAIDINVEENYSHRGSTVYAGSFWNPAKSEFSIPRNGVLENAFKAVGWKWGGNWPGNYQDYMHFSYTGN